MPNEITISGITGTSPYDIYTCDTGKTTCIYIDTVSSSDLPVSFDVPLIFESQPSVNIKIVDDVNCEINEIVIF